MDSAESGPLSEPFSMVHVTYVNLLAEAIDRARLRVRTSVMLKEDATDDLLRYNDMEAVNDLIRTNISLNEARNRVTSLTKRRNLIWLGALAHSVQSKNT